MKRIILASASPRRRELLERAGVNFEVIPASGEENRISDDPKEAVQQLARDKAVSVMHTIEDSADGTLVIGSDTVVVFENMILGKPHDIEDAVNTLKKLQGNTHQVYTGVSVLEKKNGVWTEHTFYESTDVTFYPVSDEEIRAYVATGEPMDKAGSYGIQGIFGIYVRGICGDYNNVVGLPVARLFYEMKKSEIDLRG
nr:Maf family protein [uncultured Blautia sp.]